MDVSILSTTTIYRKTAKGFAEIETRANRLPLKQRGVLIMVDGRMADRDLRRVVGDAAETMLRELLTAGYIEPVGAAITDVRPSAKPAAPATPTASVASPTSSAPAPIAAPTPTSQAHSHFAPPPAPPSVAEIPALRRDAVRQLTDQIGPVAETLAMKIESARTWTELRPLLVIGAQMLANTRGRSAAEAFAQRFIVV